MPLGSVVAACPRHRNSRSDCTARPARRRSTRAHFRSSACTSTCSPTIAGAISSTRSCARSWRRGCERTGQRARSAKASNRTRRRSRVRAGADPRQRTAWRCSPAPAPICSKPFRWRRRSTTIALFISDRPHLYPLARLLDEYPAISRAARRHALGAHLRLRRQRTGARPIASGTKTKPAQAGRMVAGALSAPHRELPPAAREGNRRRAGRIVRDEGIDKIVIAGDEVIVAAAAGAAAERRRRADGRRRATRRQCARANDRRNDDGRAAQEGRRDRSRARRRVDRRVPRQRARRASASRRPGARSSWARSTNWSSPPRPKAARRISK